MGLFGRHKFLVVLLGLILLTLILSALGSQNTTTNPGKTSKPKPDYQLVGEFGPNKDIKAILIDPANATEAKLTAIGKKLDAKYGSADLVRLGVYTDKKQAEIMLKDPLQPLTLKGAAADAYTKAHVAQYTVNKSTNTKTYTIFLHGSSKEVTL
jgi:hypothetical protein